MVSIQRKLLAAADQCLLTPLALDKDVPSRTETREGKALEDETYPRDGGLDGFLMTITN